MNLFKDKLQNDKNGALIYSFAPPKNNTDFEKLELIAAKQVERISKLNIDGLILYDIQDESTRTNEQRTFAYIPTISPEYYSRTFLNSLSVPKIIYKSIANHTKEMFDNWLTNNQDFGNLVFVGASSKSQIDETGFSLHDAYQLKREKYPDLFLGGVTIPERHTKKGDEHLRINQKAQEGCDFFVSQCVYNVFETLNLMSDYYYDAQDNQHEMKPVFFTLSPCGSLKTLDFMKWLGIEVPKWLYNDLKHSRDILETSIITSQRIASEILEFTSKKNIPIGFNIESVSNKKEEIDAAGEILEMVSQMMKK